MQEVPILSPGNINAAIRVLLSREISITENIGFVTQVLRRSEEKLRKNFQFVKQVDFENAIIVGDLHGSLDDLEEILMTRERIGDKQIDFTKLKNSYIFLGDAVDRGGYSFEVMMIILSLYISNENVLYLRGNHEDMFLSFSSALKAIKRPTSLGGEIFYRMAIEQFDLPYIEYEGKKRSTSIRYMSCVLEGELTERHEIINAFQKDNGFAENKDAILFHYYSLKFLPGLLNSIKRVFRYLPYCAIIKRDERKSIFCVHGGIPVFKAGDGYLSLNVVKFSNQITLNNVEQFNKLRVYFLPEVVTQPKLDPRGMSKTIEKWKKENLTPHVNTQNKEKKNLLEQLKKDERIRNFFVRMFSVVHAAMWGDVTNAYPAVGLSLSRGLERRKNIPESYVDEMEFHRKVVTVRLNYMAFGYFMTQDFLATNQCGYIVRGHQPKVGTYEWVDGYHFWGYGVHHNNAVITIHSMSCMWPKKLIGGTQSQSTVRVKVKDVMTDETEVEPKYEFVNKYFRLKAQGGSYLQLTPSQMAVMLFKAKSTTGHQRVGTIGIFDRKSKFPERAKSVFSGTKAPLNTLKLQIYRLEQEIAELDGFINKLK